ncbi:MAG: DUF6272 family protein [Bacteroidales bacterium]|nr:DUF6272 family protein [Bacteroidales bacterium]MDY0140296.1 DUF6272 family protein [Bacteroidales bacterium]
MKHEEKILCYYETTQNADAGAFVALVSEQLSNLKTKIKKRIILSAVELLQNNLIYNNKNAAIFQVIETTSDYIVEIKQAMETAMIENIIKQLKNINEIEVVDLQGIYQKNLSTTSNSTGNGHVFCRIKSENPIDFYISGGNIFIIKLKFNKL